MPTRSEFERAVDLFSSAAERINDLAISAHAADTTQVLQGGSLGHQVARRVALSASSASWCHQQVMVAIDTCRLRAEAIASYEVELRTYELNYQQFRQSTFTHAHHLVAWLQDETGTVPHPGGAPLSPPKPTPPSSDWAEVRRP